MCVDKPRIDENDINRQQGQQCCFFELGLLDMADMIVSNTTVLSRKIKWYRNKGVLKNDQHHRRAKSLDLNT